MSIAKAASQLSNQSSAISLGDVERQLRTMRSKANGTESAGAADESNFFAMLKDGLKDVNSTVKESEKATVDMAAGKSVNLTRMAIKFSQSIAAKALLQEFKRISTLEQALTAQNGFLPQSKMRFLRANSLKAGR